METSFCIRQIVGILQIRSSLRHLSAEERLATARQCVDFARHHARCQDRATTDQHRGGGGATRQRPTPRPAHNSQLLESMVQLQQYNTLVESYSSLAGLEAELTVNNIGITVKLINYQNEVLTRHLVSWLAVLWFSPENELVYIGREKEIGKRVAVVLQMMSQEAGRCVVEIHNSRWIQKPVLQPLPQPVPVAISDDPFYVNIGFASEDQEKLYYIDVPSRHTKKNEDYKALQKHLRYFIEDEIKYCRTLGNLIRLRNGLNDVQLNYVLRRWDLILKVHEDMNLKKFVSTRNLVAGSITECLLENMENLECYIDYIRETLSMEKGSLEHFSQYQEVRENVFLTRKRIHFYFSNLESWLKFLTNKKDEDKVKKAVDILKHIYKTADSLLIVDSVKRCPLNLNLYLPLLKQGMFTVVGKNFKKDELYKLLLFEDLLVFTESSFESLNCFEAFRLEQIVVMSPNEGSKKKHSIRLEMNHGERRGREIIRLVGRKEGPVRQFEDDIMNILTRLALKIKQMRSTQ